MSNTKWILSVVLLLPGAHSAVLAAPAEQPPNISFVAHAETPDITRTIDASQYFRTFPRLPAARNTSIQKAPAPVLAEVSEREFGNPYDMIISDRSGRTSIDFGVYAAPESFLVDASGTIVFKQLGALTPEVIEQEILPRIGKQGSAAR